MGNTDTLHPNSCFCSFSIPTSENKIFVTSLLLVYIYNYIIIAILLTTYMRQSPTPLAALWVPIPTYNVESARGGGGWVGGDNN